jgi:hypothetical protein
MQLGLMLGRIQPILLNRLIERQTGKQQSFKPHQDLKD